VAFLLGNHAFTAKPTFWRHPTGNGDITDICRPD
jgi:hypothetical protein